MISRERHVGNKKQIPRLFAVVCGILLLVLISSVTVAAATETYVYVLKWGSSGSTDGKFSSPHHAAIYADTGNIYVTDTSNHRVQVFNSTGSFIRKWGSSGTGDSQFNAPNGIAVDGSGNVYVADHYNHRIQKFTSTGTFVTKWGSSGTGDGNLTNPTGVAVDSSGNVYVADYGNNRIQVFSSTGTFIRKWGSGGSGDGNFNGPSGIAVDGSGYVYVTDSGNNRIQKFDSAGTFQAKWGSYGTGDSQFKYPKGVAVDGSGNVFVTDTSSVVDTTNHRIQKFTSTGTFVTKWGSYGDTDGKFKEPYGIAVDGSGYVYVVDLMNNRVQKFMLLGAPTVSSITPNTGVNTGTVSITNLAGTNFNTASFPTVNLTRSGETNLTATGVSVPSFTRITCTFNLTGAAAGQWNVVVTNPDGKEGSLSNGFTVLDPAPTVTGITPNTGINTGTVSITDLSGTNFNTTTMPIVNLTRSGETNLTATGVGTPSSTQITCSFNLTGAAAGQWNVVVTNPDGQSGTLANGFTVLDPAPTVSSITPNTGTSTGSVSITNLAGTNFNTVTLPTVNLTRSGETNLTATGVGTPSSTQITCSFNLTGAAAGQWNVVVTNPDGQSGTLANGFTITDPAPTVTGITPNTAINIGIWITNITGTNFNTATLPTVNLTRSGETNITAMGLATPSSTLITTCMFNLTGAAAGQWNVVVTNPDGQSGTLANGFTITDPAPTVSSITPNTGVNTGTVSITNLAGTNFNTVTLPTVNLTRSGATNLTATGVATPSSTQITCTFDLSGAAAGQWNVVVTNPDGQSGTLANGFTITDPAPAATITVTSPNGGEIWKQGTIHTIRWTYTGDPGANVKIQLLKAGVVKKVISKSAPIGSDGSGSFKWKVPFNQELGKDYKIRIISTTDTTKRDASDKVFTISAGAPITVRVPNGGEVWKRGTIQTIKWKYTGNPGAKVKIALLKGTKVNSVITAATTIGTGGVGSYKWKIPANQVTGTDYKIRVTSTTQTAKKDVSNKVFRIKA